MTISNKRLKELERAERKLQALEAGGVDNWEWYGESLSEFHKEEGIEELIDDFILDVQEHVLVDGINVEYPSVREAGFSTTLTDAGEEILRSLLKKYLEDIKELGE